MPDNEYTFHAYAKNLLEIMDTHHQAVGFEIPRYQREYDWDKKNIQRLLEDFLNGFHSLITEKNKQVSYTFLGTIILVKGKPSIKKSAHLGDSLFVVDGQQRLITLALLCCALIEQLIIHSEDIKQLQESVIKEEKEAIEKELEKQTKQLFRCTNSRPDGDALTYPRIIRAKKDSWGTKSEAEYRSIVALFLDACAKYYESKDEQKKFNPQEDPRILDNKKNDRLFGNYEYIKKQIQYALYDDDSKKSDLEIESLRIQNKEIQGHVVGKLFSTLNTFDEKIQNKIKTKIRKEIPQSGKLGGLIRLILFSSYITKYVIITQVETRDGQSAFDIFEALNTTGEPLTALDTLRPKIIDFEDENPVNRSDFPSAEDSDEKIKEILDEVCGNTINRQGETKAIVIASALYIEGRKLQGHLRLQRNYLRLKFDKCKAPADKRRFVASIANVAKYRLDCWNKIEKLEVTPSLQEKDLEILKFCLQFIAGMNDSLIVPILARYWVEYRGNSSEFFGAVKAITAFLVLRRSVTGGTKNIDAIFRNLMKGKPVIGENMENPICIGLNGDPNPIPKVTEFKKILKDYLKEDNETKVENKRTWVKNAQNTPLGKSSDHLCRFLLFTAAHNSRPAENGLSARKGVKSDDGIEFLKFNMWNDERYETVEHIAPVKLDKKDDWASNIYEQDNTIQTIGNLTLLPKRENSSMKNASWPKKRIFYKCLSAKTVEEVTQLLSENPDIKLTKKTQKRIKDGNRLGILDPLTNVEEWTEDFIRKRTENILELVWDEISPWLDY